MSLRKYYIKCVKKFTVLATTPDEALQKAQEEERRCDPDDLDIYDDHEASENHD